MNSEKQNLLDEMNLVQILLISQTENSPARMLPFFTCWWAETVCNYAHTVFL